MGIDNKLALNANWDCELLTFPLEGLNELGADDFEPFELEQQPKRARAGKSKPVALSDNLTDEGKK